MPHLQLGQAGTLAAKIAHGPSPLFSQLLVYGLCHRGLATVGLTLEKPDGALISLVQLPVLCERDFSTLGRIGSGYHYLDEAQRLALNFVVGVAQIDFENALALIGLHRAQHRLEGQSVPAL